jgi:hypothetical protein
VNDQKQITRPKITKAERIKRVAQVRAWLLDGVKPRKMLPLAVNLGWKVSIRTLRYYVTLANREIQQYSNTDRDKQLDIANARFERIYRLAMETRDLKTAIRAESERVDLLGLDKYAERQYEKLEEYDVKSLSTDELEAKIIEVTARMIVRNGPTTELLKKKVQEMGYVLSCQPVHPGPLQLPAKSP